MALVKSRVICDIYIDTNSETENEIAQDITHALRSGSPDIVWADIDVSELEFLEDPGVGQYCSDLAYEERRDMEAA